MTRRSIQQLQGVAKRDSLHKTVSVEVNYSKIHPLYLKKMFKRRNFLVHTEKEIKKGDKVVISPKKKVSKNKAWEVI